MNYEKWEAAKNNGINLANCYHFGEDTNGNICGAMAVWYMPMPGNIPDMPLCRNHKRQYADITTEEILQLILEEFSEDMIGDDDDT